jgi:hypothetical protein
MKIRGWREIRDDRVWTRLQFHQVHNPTLMITLWLQG